MTVIRPCIIGQMGSTTYFQTTMSGYELASAVRPAQENDGWATASIEERLQRKFDLKRIRTTLVPYLATHPDRFFGSIIVLAPSDSIRFEPLSDLADEPVTSAYRAASRRLGFLTVDHGELIALDGQHRLLAYRELVAGGPALGAYAGEAIRDEVSVLLLQFENAQKTRRIFNKVNRHARPTSRADNIITSEDDGYAIVSRRLINTDRGGPLGTRFRQGERFELVNWTSNTLGQNSRQLTTLSAVYETVKAILTFEGFVGFSEATSATAPSDQLVDEGFRVASRWWSTLLSLKGFSNALAEPAIVRTIRNDNQHAHNLLLRPIGQVALVHGIVRSCSVAAGALTLPDAVNRAEEIDWSTDFGSVWRGSIIREDGRVSARREDVELASEIVAYLLAGEFMSEQQRDELSRAWNRARGTLDVDSTPGLSLPVARRNAQAAGNGSTGIGSDE